MKRIAQTRLGKSGLSDFRKTLYREADISMRKIQAEGFKGVNSDYYIWRRKNITLLKSRATGAYVAVESYAWDQQPPPVADFNKYYRRKEHVSRI